LKSAHRSQVQWQEIEKQRPVGLRRQGHHLAFLILPGVIVDPLQVGGLSAQTWTVVHQLAVDFARRKVDERHLSLVRTRSETYSTRVEGRPAARQRVWRVTYSLLFSAKMGGGGRLFWTLVPGGDVIVIAPLGASLTCETASATFAPWQKRTSPPGAHLGEPKQAPPPHLS